MPASGFSAVSIYDHEYEHNEEKRLINIIQPSIIQDVVRRFEKSNVIMSEGNFLQGELTVDSIILIDPEGEMIDLTAITTQIDIFESIDKSFLSGRINVIDALGIADDYKIVGQEHITIKYRIKEDVNKFSDQFIEKYFVSIR